MTSSPDFFRSAWAELCSGPQILRPRHIGNYEPLKRVEVVDVDAIVNQGFIFANGTRMRGSASPPVFMESRYFNVTIYLNTAANAPHLADEVYDWLRSSFAFSVVYMGTPSDELMRNHLEFHQMLNSGLVEVSLHRALERKHLLDKVELAV